MSLVQSVQSREFVRVAVAATEAGAAVNPTTDTVTMAFPVQGVAPVSGDFKAASWETDGSTYYARCLVGPSGAVALAVGVYDCWLKISDSPEVPVKRAGVLKITP